MKTHGGQHNISLVKAPDSTNKPTSPTLTSILVHRADLTEADLESMYQVFDDNFHGVTRNVLLNNLANKDWVILLRDPSTQQLEGFSSMALYETTFNSQPISIVCSGDTVINRAYWGTFELARSWIQAVIEKSAGMTQPLYWLNISSSYRTYRFFKVFFKEFYPCHKKSTPPEMQAVMDHIASERYGTDYHRTEGIIRFKAGVTYLKEDIAKVTDERLQDPHIAFYISKNPGHINGDDLVCLTKVHPDNYTSAGKKMARHFYN